MHPYRIQLVLLLLVVAIHSSTFSQTDRMQNAVAAPTESNFTYPQSLYVDSQNGHIWVTDFDSHRVLRFDVSSLTTVERKSNSIFPSDYFLAQNYPNPFNPATQILFSLKNTSHASLTVYNLLGQEVATLFNEVANANTVYSIPYEPKNLPTGIYLYTLRSENGYEVKKMCLLK